MKKAPTKSMLFSGALGGSSNEARQPAAAELRKLRKGCKKKKGYRQFARFSSVPNTPKNHHPQGVVVFWCARRDSNPRPSESESDALSSCATSAYALFYYPLADSLYIIHSFAENCKGFLCRNRAFSKKYRKICFLRRGGLHRRAFCDIICVK